MHTAFPDLLELWHVELQAQHKSDKTLKHYVGGVTVWLRWCETNGVTPELTKEQVNKFLLSLFERGNQPATVKARYAALRRFSAYLVTEGILTDDIFKTMTPPSVDTKITESLTDDELKDLITVCKRDKTFRGRRDEALIRLFAETGVRSDEMLSLTIDDIDIVKGVALVRRGKGGRGRVVAFGPETGAALGRYRVARASHPAAGYGQFWLGERGSLFSYTSLYRAIIRRGRQVGLDGLHPHQLRNTFATRWLAAGGSEGGLMSMAGWSSRAMLDRYTKASASSRAADESRRLRLGDI